MSPLLANLFLHYALDRWLSVHRPGNPFCRYADDGIVHCTSEAEANEVREQLAARLGECGLEMHPEKTRIVYCKDSRRMGTHDTVSFDFLGYTFRPRSSKSRDGRLFVGFTPAISRASLTAIRQRLRQCRLQLRSEWSLERLADWLGPRVRGWQRYYCRFRGSEFQSVARHVDEIVVRWAMRKYKRLRGHRSRARAWLARVKRTRPALFAHWSGRGAFSVGAMGAR